MFSVITGSLAYGSLSNLSAAGSSDNKSPSFETVQPLLKKYCFDCHGNGKKKGEISFDRWSDHDAMLKDQKTWERVLEVVQSHTMPPEDEEEPTVAERDLISKWIDKTVFDCDCDNPDPGRVTIRRLNRVEYNNTIRDLAGVDFKPAKDFPVDDSGYGFDNIGDALSLPPVLMEKYLAAAQQILDQALAINDPAKPSTKKYAVDLLEVGYNSKRQGDGWVGLNSVEEDDVAVNNTIPLEGEYLVRVRAYAKQESEQPIKLTFMLDGTPVKVVHVETNQAAPKIYEARFSVSPGKHRFRAVVRRNKDGLSEAEALEWKTGTLQKGAVFVEYMEIEGPFNVKSRSIPDTHRKLFFVQPQPGGETEAAREILKTFTSRAYRRPVTETELERLVQFVKNAWQRGESFESGVALGFQAVLVSPHFLFRGELQPEPDNPKSVHLVGEFALASRLSYFLWSSMPDEALFSDARNGTLRKNLPQQIQRMLKDPKARSLVDNFAGQWLQLRNLSIATPDTEMFPEFDENLRTAMQKETEHVFEYVMQEDRSILEFLNGDYTFLNRRLALHYGISSIQGDEFRRVSLKDLNIPRRGLLTHASVLTITSNPTRTSPVKRGKWILENILGSPPPPPPPNVPELSEAKEKTLTGTLRERMEQHRADPACASCHARMDPLGFGFENFNAVGGWRTLDGQFPVEAGGKLTTGESFQGISDLTRILSEQKKDQFVRCLTEKMLTYALGRGLEYYDKCALEEITQKLAKQDHRFSALVMEVVNSTPFQKRRGDALASH